MMILDFFFLEAFRDTSGQSAFKEKTLPRSKQCCSKLSKTFMGLKMEE